MNVPYWGILSPGKVKSDSIPQKENDRNDTHDEDADIYCTRMRTGLVSTNRFSSQSQKSNPPTLSSLSPTPSDIPRGGLAPRPSSLYCTTDHDLDFVEKRRQRQSRYQEPSADNDLLQSRLSVLGLAYPGTSSYSHISSFKNDNLQEFQAVDQSGLINKVEQSSDPIDCDLENNGDDPRVEIKKSEHGFPMSSANIVGSHSKKKNRFQRIDLPTRACLMPEDEIKNQLEFAPDRSPLQMLEMTLDSITKEEMRARSAEAEIDARNAYDVQETERSSFRSESQPVLDTREILPLKHNGRNLSEDHLDRADDHHHFSLSRSSLPPKNYQAVDSVSRKLLAGFPSHPGKSSAVESNSLTTTASNVGSRESIGVSMFNKKTPSRNSQFGERVELAKSDRELASLRESIEKVGSLQDTIPRNKSQSLKDKTQLSLPDEPLKHELDIKSGLLQVNSSKHIWREAFSKLSRLRIEKFFKNGKADLKSSRENYHLYAQNSHGSDFSSSRGAQTNSTQTEPIVNKEDHQNIDESVKGNEKFPEKDNCVSPRRLDEWKKGAVAQLSGAYLDLDLIGQRNDAEKERAWRGSRNVNQRVNSNLQRKAEAYDGEYDDKTAPTRFKPPLFLRCGPMLRYCGLRREVPRNPSNPSYHEREIWRGSVMIVCQDSHSSYELAPTLRLFLQPIELLPPPSRKENFKISPEYIDPIAGLSRIGRDGRTLYVRPFEEIDSERDLSREESADGLYDMNRTQPRENTDSKSSPKSFYDGEKAGLYKEVRGFRLHAEQGMTFWRFNLEIELRENQQRIAYRINRGPATGFWVPPRGRAMNIMFYGCNSFSRNVNPDKLCGPDPMWRDVMNTHQTYPFHVMLGGGNQICNDDVIHVIPTLKAWLDTRESINKEHHPFPSKLQCELEAFYLNNYCMWFSQGFYGLAVSQIPMVNMFADHDIVDGFGSRHDRSINSPILSGVSAVAFKYYMLFQHQSSIDEDEDSEPSWILGEKPGPVIPELSRTIFTRLGRTIAFLGLDCRTEMTSDEIIRTETSSKIFARLRKKVIRGDTKHLLVLMAIPNAHIRPTWLEKRNSSKIIQPLKDLKRRENLKKRSSNGGEETQDEPVDHWITRNIREERKCLIQNLQELAAAKSVRITILSGDGNMGAIGILYSNPKYGLVKTNDFRYMPNIISSAIANSPVSETFANLINNKNKVRHLDAETDEDMVPIFIHDVDGQIRSNHCFLSCRNWCSIREYSASCDISWRLLDEEISNLPTPRGRSLLRRLSGSHGSRKSSAAASRTISARQKPIISRPPLSNQQFFHDSEEKIFPRSHSLSSQGSVRSNKSNNRRRTLSLTRKDFNPIGIFRLNSRRQSISRERAGYKAISANISHQKLSQDNSFETESDDICYFPTLPKPIRIAQEKATAIDDSSNSKPLSDSGDHADTNNYSIVSSGLDHKQIQNKKYPDSTELEGGLEICLNVEINPRNPSGVTIPYRLIVPALVYEKPENSPKDRDDISLI